MPGKYISGAWLEPRRRTTDPTAENQLRPVLLSLLLLLPLSATAAEPLRIAVAANFRGTLEAISARFQAETGQEVRISSASTGVLATQILHGAPFDLFLAADGQAPAALLQAGIGRTSECYARGELVLVGGSLDQLADPTSSAAIANPDTAPYGSAAVEILARPEFESGTERKLVRGSNVLQAYQFWRSGAVDLALVARALAPQAATAIPMTWYPPLEQHLLLIRESPAATAYLNWLRSDTVRSLILQAGYRSCP